MENEAEYGTSRSLAVETEFANGGTQLLPEPPSGRRPATILHLIDCLAPGGSEQQLLLLLRSTDRRRWRPIVGAFHKDGLMRREIEAQDVPVAEFPLRTSLL